APPLPDYVLGPEHTDDEIVAEDQPYAKDASPTAQSPEYVPESDLEAHPEDDDDKDPEEDPANEEEEEEHPAPADSVVVALTAADQAPSAEETEPFESDESAAIPSPHPVYRMTARIFIPAPIPVPAWSDSEVVRLLAMSSPPSSPLSPWSSPPPQIPFPPLPPILSPPSPVLSQAPPPSPIRSLGYAPSSRTPLLLPISASTLSPPLQPPSASRREDRPEVTLPPQKRLAGGLRADYGFVATMDREIMRDPERDASDLVRGEVMSLRTTVLGQMTEIKELHAADRRRQIVISVMLRGQVIALQAQVTALQGHQGLAGGPTQPELPKEAGSNS
nr:hypothetical protein [Tanacetum cinerariifolium]